MSVAVRDVLMTDIVFAGVDLLSDPAAVQRCGSTLDIEFVQDGTIFGPPPAPGLQPVQGQSLRIPRERILIETSSARTRFVKEYPSNLDDALSIIPLACLAVPVNVERPVPPAHGFNIHLVYRQDSGEHSIHYLARRLFDYQRIQAESWELLGGFGTLIFVDGPIRWTVKVEPRFQDERTPLVFFDLNIHVSEPDYPSGDSLNARMTDLWSRAHELIEAIDNE